MCGEYFLSVIIFVKKELKTGLVVTSTILIHTLNKVPKNVEIENFVIKKTKNFA